MKKLSLSALLLALVLALAACGGAPSESGTPSSESNAPPIEGETPPAPEEPEDLVFGTATLTFAEFYAGDVSSVDSYDAVTSATTSHYEIMPNMATDFVDEAANADGYRITGVQNVNVAVPAGDVDAYKAFNASFTPADGEAPSQYKVVTMESGQPIYSATQFNIADTVTDATATLQTGTVWGDYQISVADGATIHLRNSMEDDFDIGSGIQGIILETDSGLRVGLEYLQSVWVQPRELSFNVPEDNTHNANITNFDNLPALGKLVGETVTKVIYIMPDSTYVYEFEGIYIKPPYTESITAAVSDGYDALTLSTTDFSGFENGKLTVTYTLGSGRNREITTLLETALTDGTADYSLDISALAGLDTTGVYGAVISSDTYADVTVPLPVSTAQRAALEELLTTANEKLAAEPENAILELHIEEGEELLGNESASSSETGSLIAELTDLTAEVEEGSSENQGGGH